MPVTPSPAATPANPEAIPTPTPAAATPESTPSPAPDTTITIGNKVFQNQAELEAHVVSLETTSAASTAEATKLKARQDIIDKATENPADMEAQRAYWTQIRGYSDQQFNDAAAAVEASRLAAADEIDPDAPPTPAPVSRKNLDDDLRNTVNTLVSRSNHDLENRQILQEERIQLLVSDDQFSSKFLAYMNDGQQALVMKAAKEPVAKALKEGRPLKTAEIESVRMAARKCITDVWGGDPQMIDDLVKKGVLTPAHKGKGLGLPLIGATANVLNSETLANLDYDEALADKPLSIEHNQEATNILVNKVNKRTNERTVNERAATQ